MAIHHLLGELVEKQPTRVVIDVGGVGYELIVPLSSHACLPDVGATARILTVEQHRDDVRLLFGFATDAERRMFRLLTTVSGVGPKLAIATLGHLAVDRLAGCILAGDTAAIRKIPGVGQKLADRIVLELRNSITVAAGVTGPARPTAAVGDAEAALVSLGYRPEDARRLVDAALRKHPDQSDDVEALIRLDLEAARLAQEQASREIPPAPAAVLANQQAEYVPVGSAGTGQLVVINNPPMRLWSPGLAAALSFLVPGLGQLYKGQIISGILWFLFVCMGYAALVVPGLILHFFCVLGALSGNPWTEGKTTVVRQ